MREDTKMKNVFPNLIENFFLIHFDDISIRTLNNSVYQVVINSLPNIIQEEKFSSFQKLTFIRDIKNETGYSLQLKPEGMPLHIKQFANKIVESVANVYKEM